MTEIKNDMTFEEAYKALEETVRKLEDPAVDFQTGIRLYEQACELVACCQRLLGEAKTRITDINEHIARLGAGAAIPEE